MISSELRPIDHTAEINLEQIGEALAFSYLAYYNAASIGPRPYDSYKRAWGFDRLVWFPRAGVDPGFVVAFWDRPKQPKVLVAIEGTTNLAQIAPVSDVTATTPPAAGPGRVMTSFKNKADVVHTKLMANFDFTTALNSRVHRIVFTGHSLGAALADIVATRFRIQQQSQTLRLIKFASPRVGTPAYVRRTTGLVNRCNVYCDVDPIWRYPRAGLFSTLAVAAINHIFGQSPQREENRLQIAKFGTDFGAWGFPNEDGLEDPANWASLLRPLAINNRWYCHVIKTYRLWFMNIVQRMDPFLAYRFNYLEHPDENAWQQRYSPGQRTWDTLDGLLVTAPDDMRPPTPMVAVEAGEDEAAGEVGGGDWGSEPGANGVGEGGGDWGQIVPPSVTSHLPRRRFTRPRPS